ncbi:hypothetical protein [Kiloniella sp. b19]|uniref:hypothetical protein n=1 Tax=Kiloniella sp. GXU_MW_B19 TaxID=3141326 RepID=UPI0031DA864C
MAFHYYGAIDCPPCVAFKKEGLPVVSRAGLKNGFEVRVHQLAKTVDVFRVGSFGSADPLLREAALELDSLYPPVFVITLDGALYSSHGFEWEEALEAARSLAR